MADILIKGLKGLPKDGDYLHLIIQDGNVHTAISCGHLTTDKLNVGTAMELPPHEHLTEKSAFWNMLHEICVKCNDSGDIDRYPNRCIWCKIKEAYEKVYQTPTILEANT